MNSFEFADSVGGRISQPIRLLLLFCKNAGNIVDSVGV